MGHEGHDHGAPAAGPSSSSPAPAHQQAAPAQVAAFAITCSDSRDAENDESGKLIRERLTRAGHLLTGHRIIPNDDRTIRSTLEQAIGAGARAVILTGGTGISSRDRTVEVVSALFERRLDGFGELFRSLSFAAIGPSAMLTRAVAGTWRGAVIFALPGSPHAVELAMDRLIVPELGHVVRELTR